MVQKESRVLETILLEYIERFGLTPAARRHFRASNLTTDGPQNSTLSPSEIDVSLDRFGYLP